MWGHISLVDQSLLQSRRRNRGFIQEGKADSAIEALMNFAAPDAQVIRDGKEITIKARELVPGDIILIHEGDMLPADGRIFEESNMKAEEAALTGESKPLLKKVGDSVLGGSINGSGALTIVIEKTRDESYFAQIEGLKELGQSTKILEEAQQAELEEVREKYRKIQIEKYLKDLKPIQRDIIIMRGWQDMSYRDISVVVGKSDASCKMTYSRSISKLRNEIPLAILIYLVINQLG